MRGFLSGFCEAAEALAPPAVLPAGEASAEVGPAEAVAPELVGDGGLEGAESHAEPRSARQQPMKSNDRYPTVQG